MKKDPRQKQLKVFGIGLPILLLFIAWRHYAKTGLNNWTLPCALLAGLLTFLFVFRRDIFERLFDIWMKVAGGIGFCVTTILLSVIYYGVLTPTAFILRLGKNDFMAKTFNI
mgnify:FL=1